MKFVCLPRPDGFSDKNDCTVLALANAIDIPYAHAHEIMTEQGRVVGQGMTLAQYKPVYDMFGTFNEIDVKFNISDCEKSNGTEFQRVTKSGRISVKRFLKENPDKTYIAHIKGHVFCVKKGVILDTFKPGERQRIDYWWEISE